MILAIDFDGVIHDPNNREPGYKMGKPVPGALDALELLQSQGHHIIIHSVKAHENSGVKAIRDWMGYFGFPVPMYITANKPNADAYIDDRAIHFDDWSLVLRTVELWQENGTPHANP